MRPFLVLLLILDVLMRLAAAQATPSPAPTENPPPATNSSTPQSALDRLTQSNRDLLDLLKKQQAVLEDIQLDRRLQSRQIQMLEERLETTLQENARLQAKASKLEATLAAGPAAAPASAPNGTNAAPAQPAKEAETTPAPPATYLQPPEPEGASGSKSWHRLFTLSGSDPRQSDLFHIQGRRWRVLWHNQDKPGTIYQNTSALFINAFPKDDTIPQKVCSKLGSGGDSPELDGPGNYYLKIEASGGSWELAVEDFR